MPDFDRHLTRPAWEADRSAYRVRVRPWADARVRRTSCGETHPVHDFLFEYYSRRPVYLLRWTPGVGVRLDGARPADTDWPHHAVPCPGGAVIPAAKFPPHRRPYLDWAVRYLAETGDREPVFGCFGLHEWAMVYREPEVRHRAVPLRLSRADTDAVVDAGAVRCTHYDAYRFFTPAAIPLNRFALDRAGTTAHDQPGCVT